MVKLCDAMLLLQVGTEFRAVGLHPELGTVETVFRRKPAWNQAVAGLNRKVRSALSTPRLAV